MIQARNLLQGILLTATTICLLLTLTQLPKYTNTITATAFFFLLAIPFAANLTLKIKNWKQKKQPLNQEHAKVILLALQGTALACWALDLVTSTLVLNIRVNGIEINPLGWPLGILGAALYYVPTVTGTYVLLYKIQTKSALYSAAVLTMVALYMGSFNLDAGLNNFQIGMHQITAWSHPEIIGSWLAIIALLTALNIATVVRERKKPKLEQIIQTPVLIRG
jgi:hypothetical protein